MNHLRHFSRMPWAVCVAAGVVAALAGCVPPIEVIDIYGQPQVTRDAMLGVQIVPLGAPVMPIGGSLGQVDGFACGVTPAAANGGAIQQLQIKALRLHATAVISVLTAPAPGGACGPAFFGATANGTAVAPRGIPSTY